MKKILFVDRDGTLIKEPPITEQVNSLEEMVFVPYVISSLKRFKDEGFEIIMVTNQDGLGTKSNPLDNYNLINNKMLEIFASEEIIFSQIFLCPHLKEEKCNCRKPKTGMLIDYLNQNQIDKENSLMVGDRETDIEFANNIGVKGFLLSEKNNWKNITDEFLLKPRRATIKRDTKETQISLELNIDGQGNYEINTGLKFFDHMLEQLSKHSLFDIKLFCNGDLQVDEHHTIEDTAIVIGQALKKALGDKRGIERFSWERILVMDEAKAEVSMDISGRPFLVFDADFNRDYAGDLPTDMIEHFFQSFCTYSNINMNIKIEGKNTHHMVEACFKAFARCLKDATRKTSSNISSTKGIL